MALVKILLNENLLKLELIMYQIFALLRFLLKHEFTISAIIDKKCHVI